MLKKISKFISRHKIIAGLIALLIVGGVYFGYKTLKNNKQGIRYALAAAKKGTLVVSISGSGQVSASDQLDIKSKVNAEVISAYVKKGQEVKAGELVAKLDDTDAQNALRSAEISFETARLELEKLLTPDEITLLQAENSLIQAKQSGQKAEDNVEKTYEDGLNAVANAFLGLPEIMRGFYDILFAASFNGIERNISYYANAVRAYDEKILQYQTDAYDKYQIARNAYEQNLQDYRLANKISEKTTIESLVDQTHKTVKDITEALRNANNLIQFYQDTFKRYNLQSQPFSDAHLSNLDSYAGKINSYLSSLSVAQRSFQESREALASAERLVEEKELSLKKLRADPEDLDIRAKKIAVQQKEDAFITAKQNLAYCYVKAPFDGIVADIKVKKGDSVSTGTVMAIVITKQRIAEIFLNEVDAAKVKTGQRATLTFDAFPDINISGKVVETDVVGTESQGVVSYGVKIVLDTQDERVKPGMSVAADIITDVKQDVLILPSTAIKSQGGFYYVEVVEASEESKQQLLASISGATLSTLPRLQLVETGLSNDLSTEIISGLKEGDIVVTSTISSNSSTSTSTGSSQNRGFQIMRGLDGGGGPPR